MNALTAVIPMMPITDVERIALAIAKGGLFGSKDPNAVLTLCLLAQAEGQHPAVVFRDYHIISGKPAKKADAMLRDFISAGGRVKWHALDDEIADATFTHPSGEARIEWTLERARQAGIANPMWKKYPRQMLRSRVISEGVRTVYPGATSGLYEVGEVQDIADERRDPETPAIEHRPVADMGDAAGQGHSQEGAFSPDQQPTKRTKAPPLAGPYTSKTALWQAVRGFDRELRSCGDLDELEAFLTTDDTKALIVQLERDAPQLLHGGDSLPDEFEPLHSLIAKLRTDLEAASESWRTNPMRAG